MSFYPGQLKHETYERGATSLTRRSFLQTAALTTSGFLLMKSSALDANSQSQLESPWYRMAYRRNVCDFADNGKSPDDPKLSNRLPHTGEVRGGSTQLLSEGRK